MKKENWFKKHMVLTIIGGLIIVGMIGSAVSGNKSTTSTPTTTQTPMSSPVPSPTASTIGKSPIPSSSADPCEPYAGTTQWSSCENNQRKQNKLNAKVQATVSYMLVTNLDNVDWTGCQYSIGADINMDSAYEINMFDQNYGTSVIIPAHQSLKIPWGVFTQSDGTRFNFIKTQPDDINIDCGGSNWTNY
jgi:hypothetical protein